MSVNLSTSSPQSVGLITVKELIDWLRYLPPEATVSTSSTNHFIARWTEER